MKRTILLCAASLGVMLAFLPSSTRADADQPKVDVPFGILVRGAACPAATHTVLSPCYPFPPTAFAVFPQGKNVTRYEGQNVTMRGTVDQTSCALPLLRATRVALSDSFPPCPPPACQPGDPPPCPQS
jgi:hypothetical protein